MQLKSPLNKDQALYARDALAKGVYDRLFTWIVKKINDSLNSRVSRDIHSTTCSVINFYHNIKIYILYLNTIQVCNIDV